MSYADNRAYQGANRLRSRLMEKAGITVNYARGATEITGVTAIPGRFDFEVDGGLDYVGITLSQMRDFLIDASEITALGEPAIEDRITEIDQDGNERTYQVLHPAGDQPWRWSDEFHLTFRIHARNVSAEVI